MNPVRRARKQKGLTLAQLAMIAGVSTTRIYQIERGDNARLSAPVVDALATLGYDPDKLATEYEQWRQKQVEKVLKWARSGGDGAA